ncbi:3-hydroxyisobutyrate dehydrogenase-like beta-hydroxyacid dehydrogenase [Novosphingobium sp. SG751A]|nr:3-hydroxyisobutyrate dehydrogenase-like beta-hydroxyacid dehydrogenase [Novosphingobium sp. SG751A]
MKIAFIGLGNMGGGMAANLVKAGHQVHAFDLAQGALDRAGGNGCATFASARDAVAGVDMVITMLTNGPVVKAVYAADVIGHAPAGALLLDCSTIDVASAREVTARAQAGGYRMVDAP